MIKFEEGGGSNHVDNLSAETKNYFYAIIGEAFSPPSRILDYIYMVEAYDPVSEQEKTKTVERYRNTILELAFAKRDNLLPEENKNRDIGINTASLRIMSLRKEYGLKPVAIEKIRIKLKNDLSQIREFQDLAEKIDILSSQVTPTVLSKKNKKNLAPER